MNGVIEFIFFLLTCFIVFFSRSSLSVTKTLSLVCIFLSLLSRERWLFITIASQVQSVVFFVVDTNVLMKIFEQARSSVRTKESKLVLFNIRIQFFTFFSWENFFPTADLRYVCYGIGDCVFFCSILCVLEIFYRKGIYLRFIFFSVHLVKEGMVNVGKKLSISIDI